MQRMEIDDSDHELANRSRTQDIWKDVKRWAYRVVIGLAFLFAIITSISLFKYGPQGYRFARDFIQPYKRFYASTPISDSAVVPLFNATTPFDIAVTIWKRDDCESLSTSPWSGDDCDNWTRSSWPRYRGMESVETATLNVKETVLFSGVVVKDFSLGSEDQVVDIPFLLPVEQINDPWRTPSSAYDIRAAVTFNPRSPSLLDHVAVYTAATPDGMIVPPTMGDNLPDTGNWGTKDSIRRKVLEGLTVHLPLSRISWRNRPVRSFINHAHVYLINETHPFQRDTWETEFNKLRDDSSFCKLPYSPGIFMWDSCRDGPGAHARSSYYGSKGHFLGKYELEGSGGEGQQVMLAYNPFMGAVRVSPTDFEPAPGVLKNNASNRSNRPWEDQYTQLGEEVPSEPLQVKLSLRMSVFNPTTERLHLIRDSAIYERFNEMDMKMNRDMWEFTNGLLGRPSEGANTWRRVIFVGTHKLLALAVVLLTVIYWYTRRTAAGISHWSIWVRVLVAIPNAIHYAATSDVMIIRRLTVSWLFVIVIKCIAEYYQLRLVFPIVLSTLGISSRGGHWLLNRTSDGDDHELAIDIRAAWLTRWRARHWSDRERETMHLEPKWYVAVGTFIGCFTFFYLCRGWIIPPAMPLAMPFTVDRTTRSFLARFVKGISWAGFTCASILQLLMNRKAGTFAGTYKLVAYFQVAIEICDVLYNFSAVMGNYYLRDGWSFFQASKTVFALAVMYQAVTLPRVEQEG